MKTKSFGQVFCRISAGLGLLGPVLFVAQATFASVNFTVLPSVISNTYNGPVTLQVTGLTNTETVVVQKFLITDGGTVLDSSARLFQQFQLTDGQATVFMDGSTAITNFNVPGDTDGSANGSITANLYPAMDFKQEFVGHYLFVLSSPVGHFSALNSTFGVTNFPFAQTVTGEVTSGSSPLPYAVVVLLQSVNNDDEEPVAGAVTDASGNYTLHAPPGGYLVLGIESNYVANTSTAPFATLTAGATVTANVALGAANQSLSGRLVDANNSNLGLSGCTTFVQASDGSMIAVAFTDANGNYTARVVPNQWKVNVDNHSLVWNGYNGLQNNLKVNTSTGAVSTATIPLPKATAIFYGTVKDNLGNPLPGVAIYSIDNNNLYQTDGFSYTNGYYAAPAIGGVSSDPWLVQQDFGGPANYIYSQPAFNQNGGTNFNVGQAIRADITGILATNVISGNVKAFGTNLPGVNVYASATIGGVQYNSGANTDNNGNYSVTVANGSWTVGVNCNGNDGSLDGILGNGNYECPNSQDVTINNDNGTANFTVQGCSGVQIFTSSPLPNGTNGSYYAVQFDGSSCSGNLTWTVNDPADFPPGLMLYSSGALNGTPSSSGTYNFSVHVQDDNGHSANQSYSLTISSGSVSPLQITTSFGLNNGTNGTFYSTTFQATGGVPPYGWYIPNYSASPPGNLSLSTSGVLSGTVSANLQSYYFYVDVTDSVANFYEDQFTMTVVNPPLPPLLITNVSLPNGNVGAFYSAQLGATGGQTPYNWSLPTGSAPLPPGLTVNNSGLISGTPTTNSLFAFKIQLNDSASDITNKNLAIIINPKPSIRPVAKVGTSQFQFLLTGASNQNYTIQMSTNLASPTWLSLFTTNSPTTNSYIVIDANATNQQRFYRVQVGP